MSNADRQRLMHIRRYCEDIAGFIDRFGYDFETFCEDRAFLNAVSKGNAIVPVQMEIKEYKKEENQSNRLYVTVTVGEIKEAGILTMRHGSVSGNRVTIVTPTSGVTVSEIIRNVNPKSSQLLKYIPDSMLDAEQKESKEREISGDCVSCKSVSWQTAYPMSFVPKQKDRCLGE